MKKTIIDFGIPKFKKKTVVLLHYITEDSSKNEIEIISILF